MDVELIGDRFVVADLKFVMDSLGSLMRYFLSDENVFNKKVEV